VDVSEILKRLIPKQCNLSLTIVVILILTSYQFLYAQTEVEGDVYGVWDEEGSPYLVIDTLTIPEDSILQIEPGVTVEFQDQDETRFPFYVHGTLEAIGEENDSIYFTSPDSAFPGIESPSEFEDTRIHLEYCVIDSAKTPVRSIHGVTVIRHSRIFASQYFMRTTVSIDTIEYCTFRSVAANELTALGLSFMEGGPSVFVNNDAPECWLRCSGTDMAPIHHNSLARLTLSENSFEVYDNEAGYFGAYEGIYYVHHNRFSTIEGTESNLTIESNTAFCINLDICTAVIDNNILGSALEDPAYNQAVLGLDESDATVTKNLIVSTEKAVKLNGDGDHVFDGNTFIFLDKGIDDFTESDVAVNNIFVGDGVNCPAIDAGRNPGQLENVQYNIFHNVSELVKYGDGDELHTTNIVIDPRFNAGEPFDYHLLANSPCIDAGDPDSPEDPDDTRADIGTFFYDQSIDNPPALSSPIRLVEQSGTEFNYTAIAIDDEGPLTIHFDNLPDWLEEEHDNLDWVADSAIVSGTIPEDIDQFEFNVYVEDELGQVDSAYVCCEVIQYTLLRGITTGTISADNSPYMVVDDVIVPDGDSLVIEPGVTCYFYPVEDLDQRLKFKTYGKLLVNGTSQDSVIFRYALENNEGDWKGLFFYNNNDTSIIEHAYIYGAYTGVYTDSSSIVKINKSTFHNNLFAIRIFDSSYLEVDSSLFSIDSDYPADFVIIDNSSATISNSTFINLLDTMRVIPIECRDYANVLLDGNTFYHTNMVYINYSSQCTIIRNRFLDMHLCLGISNRSTGIVANNLFQSYSEDGNYGIFMDSRPIKIVNNIFINNIYSIQIVEYTEPDSLPLIYNNIFLNSDTAIWSLYEWERPGIFNYNCFNEIGENSYNIALDTSNLFDDPLFVDTLEYKLFLESPCVNSGLPDSVYNDIDGTRNDIGLLGGPWGRSYDYESLYVIEGGSLPSTFSLDSPYPNPFNGIQIIPFSLPVKSDVTIKVFNILGREVHNRIYPSLNPGRHLKHWDASNQSSGIYFVQFQTGEVKLHKKVLLIK